MNKLVKLINKNFNFFKKIKMILKLKNQQLFYCFDSHSLVNFPNNKIICYDDKNFSIIITTNYNSDVNDVLFQYNLDIINKKSYINMEKKYKNSMEKLLINNHILNYEIYETVDIIYISYKIINLNYKLLFNLLKELLIIQLHN